MKNFNTRYEHEDDGCGCGCGCHDHGEEAPQVILTTDDGETIECGVVGIFDVEDRAYIALVNPDEEVLLYRYEEHEDEDPTLELIDSDEEFDQVVKAFHENFVDGEADEE